MPSNESLNKLFRKETVIALGKRDSQLRMTVTTEANIMANSATFMVSDIDGKKMSKRGADGRIPSNPPNDQQYEVPLVNLHYKEAKTDFDIYTQQGNQFDLMKSNVVAVAERRHDKEILATLENTTRDANTGSPVALTSNAIFKKIIGSFGTLHTASLPCVAISAGAFADMHDIKEFGNRDFVQDERFKGIPKSKAFEYFGLNFMVMPDDDFEGALTDKKFYAWLPEAVGHACDKNSADFQFGYNGEDAYSWARSSISTGSKIIQAPGVIKFHADVSANTVT